MRRILVIGIGPGSPDYMTVQAIAALKRVDVFFIPDKGEEKARLRHVREAICQRFIPDRASRIAEVRIPARAAAPADYRATVAGWHTAVAEAYGAAFARDLPEGACGGLLVWGDPAFYDSTLRILDHLRAQDDGFDYEVIPGISSLQVLAARHRIALNRIGEPVLVTTGRKLAAGFPADADSVVVMLDGEDTYRRIPPDGLFIHWGAYLGMDEEILMSGPLAEVAGAIAEVRAEARARHGWIMDIYLLRRMAPAAAP
ncbi:precorrin-6A synthase (deacetylating) [Xanthobacter sp. V4C-4]|uniref:precorrin-6A synthase (deacetylating) n=1 Tax=Xanthobacter cornucopiae TaxID=3119924 RepID=UPI0037261D72